MLDRTPPASRPLIVDLGANVGLFTARVIDRLVSDGNGNGADLVLVEGSPTMYRELESRLPELAAESTAISSINGLVGNRAGAATIAEIDFGARNTLFPENNLGLRPISEMAHHDVPFVDLTTIIEPGRRIGLLKCDIEGSEQLFLETYGSDLLGRTDVAVFEFHHRLCDVPKCLSILTESGLEVISSVRQPDETSLVLLAATAAITG
jgi:FkbM family methyltransferase